MPLPAHHCSGVTTYILSCSASAAVIVSIHSRGQNSLLSAHLFSTLCTKSIGAAENRLSTQSVCANSLCALFCYLHDLWTWLDLYTFYVNTVLCVLTLFLCAL
ncbi:hypothetical protein O6H91_Y513200 [Diphasiastrum complanatum]|nr:hypothetical protein O6H91_Y513200 [Diphasiastrum complanatum]